MEGFVEPHLCNCVISTSSALTVSVGHIYIYLYILPLILCQPSDGSNVKLDHFRTAPPYGARVAWN